jgi:hypothetical protein
MKHGEAIGRAMDVDMLIRRRVRLGQAGRRQARVTRAPITLAMRRHLTGPRAADHHHAPNTALRDLSLGDA